MTFIPPAIIVHLTKESDLSREEDSLELAMRSMDVVPGGAKSYHSGEAARLRYKIERYAIVLLHSVRITRMLMDLLGRQPSPTWTRIERSAWDLVQKEHKNRSRS